MEEQKMETKSECGPCGSCEGGKCSPMHWSCCVVPMLSLIFWIAGIGSLVLAWIAGDSMVWGKADAFWYLNSLALGVLAMGSRRKKFGVCRAHVCKDGVCK